MKKLIQNNRLAILNYRYDRLLELNQKHHYTFMILNEKGVLVPNQKEDKYTSLLLKIRAEKQTIWEQKRKSNTSFNRNINTGINAIVSLTKIEIFNLTSPMV